MNERITGRVVPVLRADGVQIRVTIEVARNTDFLKKYGMRILDESAMTRVPEVSFDAIEELPKRRPMLRPVEEAVTAVSDQQLMDSTPEVPLFEEEGGDEEEVVEEEPEVLTEESTTTKTRRK